MPVHYQSEKIDMKSCMPNHGKNVQVYFYILHTLKTPIILNKD